VARLLMYVSASGCSLYRSQWNGLQLLRQFAPKEPAALRECLDDRGGAIVQVVADLAGEDFHEDQIPFLRGAERRAVIERRLAQRYPGTPFAAALSLGQAGDERRSERLLLTSFNDSQPLLACLAEVERAGARVVSVHSTALLVPQLAARLGMAGEPFFLMSTNQAGLRQSYIESGRLRLSRLASTNEGVTASLVRTETERMLKYLGTLRAQPKSAATRVLVLVPQAERAHLSRTLAAGAGLTFTTLGLAEAARRIGLRHLPEAAGGEVLYLHLATRRAPKEQFLRGQNRRGYLVWRLQRSMVGAGLAGLAGCGAYTATAWLEQSMMRERIEGAQRDVAAMRDQLARVNARFPATQVSIEALKGSVLEFRRIAARNASPELAFGHVSRALDQAPWIELDMLAWNAEPEPTLEISGRVNAPGHADHRTIASELQRFSALLAAESRWRVVASQLPFDLSPGSVLAASAGAEPTGAPRFSLRLAQTPG